MYLRSCDPSGQVMVKLICAKSRVAPLKQISLPCLELCEAGMLVCLIVKVKNCLDLEFNDIHLWTNSSIIFAWFKSVHQRGKCLLQITSVKYKSQQAIAYGIVLLHHQVLLIWFLVMFFLRNSFTVTYGGTGHIG